MKLTDHEKRIKIAEACGWTGCFNYGHPGDFKKYPLKTYRMMGRPPKCSAKWRTLPLYLSDLNAMHEAEKVMNHPQRQRFITELYLIVGRPNSPVFATARQRAEAFGRTLNLWTE